MNLWAGEMVTTWAGGVIKLSPLCYLVTVSGGACLEMVRSTPPPHLPVS